MQYLLPKGLNITDITNTWSPKGHGLTTEQQEFDSGLTLTVMGWIGMAFGDCPLEMAHPDVQSMVQSFPERCPWPTHYNHVNNQPCVPLVGVGGVDKEN